MNYYIVAMFLVTIILFAYTIITIPLIGVGVGNIATLCSGIFCLFLSVKALMEERKVKQK